MKSKLLQFGIGIAAMLFSNGVMAQVPVSEFTLSQNVICEGASVQITDQSSDSPDQWLYTIDANTFTTQNVTYTFTSPGVYTISLIASNANGTGSVYSETVMVNPNPTLSVSGASAVCFGDQDTFTASGANTYTWSGGIVNGVSFTPTVSGTYTVNGTDANGCEAETTFSLTVNALPVLSLSGSNAVCAGSAFTQTVSGADTYTWDTGSNASAFSIIPTGSTTYTIEGTNSITGCSNTTTVSVTVNALPVITANNGTICAGDSFTISATGANTYTYSGGNAVVSPVASSNYTINGTDANGCVSNDLVINVLVNPLPVLTVNSGAICSGNSFTLSPSGASTYTSTAGSLVVNPTSTSSYTILGTDASGCVSTPVVSTVTVNPLPVITVNSGAICIGQSFSMIASGANTYTYSGGSNLVSPSTTTSYSVTGTSIDGCVSAAPAISTVTVNALPVISVNSGSICAGQSFTLIASGASTYTYSSGSSVVSPAVNTSYSVSGTSAQGCVSANMAISNVTVNALPVISVNSGAICAGQVFTLVPNGASTYTYSNGSNTVAPTANASYSVSGTSANGCVSAAAAISNVTVNALPVISVNSGAICAGQSFTIVPSGAATYTVSGGNTVVSPASTSSYTVSGTSANGCISAAAAVSTVTVNALPVISVNSGAICAGQSFTIVPTGATSYTVSGGTTVVSPSTNTSYTVSGSSANGCIGTTAAVSNVTVNPLPVISVNSGAICAGGSFVIIPTGASTYTISGGNFTVSPTANTSYSVVGTSTNGCDAAAPAISTITVNALPVITIAGTSNSLCAGNSVSLTAGGASTYTWDNGSNLTTIAVSPSVNSTYSVSGTDANNCSNIANISITVFALPTLSISSNASIICKDESVVITASGASTYSWDNGSNTASVSVSPSVTSTYTVTGTDANGCSNTSAFTQSVSECTGIRSAVANNFEVSIYPNPSNGAFSVDVASNTSLIVLSSDGRMVLSTELTAGQNRVEMDQLSNGIYTAQLQQNGGIKTIKLVINH